MKTPDKFSVSLYRSTKHMLPIFLIAVLIFFPAGLRLISRPPAPAPATATPAEPSEAKKFIKWVDFDITADAMRTALRHDVDNYNQPFHVSWVDLLAWLGARYGGDFSRYREKDLDHLVQRLQNGEKLEEITKDMKYFSYYQEAYGAVLGGMVGVFDIQIPDEAGGAPKWVTKYGLKAFSPIAKNYPYNDFDDFGVSRSYGFKRQHLGHDLMGQVGTPVIAKTCILFRSHFKININILSCYNNLIN